MVKQITIDQVLKEYKSFFNQHLMVKEFNYTVPKDRFVTKNYKYPLVLIEPNGFEFGTGEIKFNHNLYFLDIVDKDLINYMSIISNQLQIGTDFYNYFNDNECKFGFFLYNESSATPVIFDEFEDWLCGIMMPISLQIQNPRNEDEIPLS